MASRVTDQEKELWFRNMRDGHSVRDIVDSSGRCAKTIYKYTDRDSLIPQEIKEDFQELETNYYLDEIDQDNNLHEDMGVIERSIYEFIEDGGFNGGSLWGSETKRSAAQHVAQCADAISLLHQNRHYIDKYIAGWTQWIGPVATEWALTEGDEQEDVAIIYGLAASLFSVKHLNQSIRLVHLVMESFLESIGGTHDRALEVKTRLAIYRYIGIAVARHLKNNTRFSQLAAQGATNNARKTFLLAYAEAVCFHGNSYFGTPTMGRFYNFYKPNSDKTAAEQVNQRGNHQKHSELGYKTALKDINTNQASRLSRKICAADAISKHLTFLASHYELINNRPTTPISTIRKISRNIGNKRGIRVFMNFWKNRRNKDG